MSVEVEEQAETSKQGAHRMWRLQGGRMSCGASLYGCIDPITTSLAYQAPSSSPYSGHLVATLAAPLPPRQLPSPAGVTPGREINVSPDGKWVTTFHPNNGQLGGLLGIYDAAILSPSVTSANIVPISTFSLPCSVLAIHHNFPDRTSTAAGRGPSIGPRPPVTYDPSQGPSITVLCTDGIYLFHPFQALDAVALDSAGSLPIDMTADNSSTIWRIQMLRCPFHTRFKAVMGGTLGEETGLRARRGWMSAVAGSEAVWVAIEAMDELRVIRVEYGLDQLSRFTMNTVPLPACPLERYCSAAVTNGEESPSTANTELRGVVFLSRSTQPRRELNGPEDQSDGHEPYRHVEEKVGLVLVHREASTSESRTHITVLGVEKRDTELAESFKDFGSDSADLAHIADWTILSQPIQSSILPSGWSVLALYPLPAIAPSSLALALLRTPDGTMLSHVDLCDTAAPEAAEGGSWSALRGHSVAIKKNFDATDLGLAVSQGIQRGELGLVAIVSRETPPILVRGPDLHPSDSDVDKTVQHQAEKTARSVVLAMKDRSGWSDVMRASFGTVSLSDRANLGTEVVKSAYQKIVDESDLDELRHLFHIQTAVYSLLDDSRREIAAELVHLLSASYLFSQCAARGPNKRILFDLDSVWPLVTVADWVSGVLARAMRDVVAQRGKYEWHETDELDEPVPARILYIVHPALRALVLRLHTQLHAFVNFVSSVDRPIPFAPAQPDMLGSVAPLRDARATMLAKENVRDALGREGVDLIEWGKAIESLPAGSVDDRSMIEALLSLSCEPLKPTLRTTLAALPTPSALLRTASAFSEITHDGITLQPLLADSGRFARCARCGWRTAVLGDRGWLGMGRWGDWRKAQERLCACGGVWIRDAKRYSS